MNHTRAGASVICLRPLLLFVAAGAIVGASPAFGASVFTMRPDDPAAIYLTTADFGARMDGAADDTAAVQAAVDKAAGNVNGGIVLIPSGRFRLVHTVYVWRGVRVIGYGATRPV